jgi:hypothetical protein
MQLGLWLLFKYVKLANRIRHYLSPCTDTGYCCPLTGKCCSAGCAPAGAQCCSNGKYCEAGWGCCTSGSCAPLDGQCCGDGGYCEHGNICVKIQGQTRDVCCTNVQCTAHVTGGQTVYATPTTTIRTTAVTAQATATRAVFVTYTYTLTWCGLEVQISGYNANI